MQKNKLALRAAFPHTIPVLTGYIFLGIAFGILLQSKGYGPVWALLMSLFIYAGSMQFVGVGLLAGGFQPLEAALMTLMVNARHIFYGVSMLEKFRDFGKIKPYMIFSLSDETFSLLCSATPPPGVSPKRFSFFIALLDQGYWVAGSVLGALLGSAIRFDTTGIDFVMTALFVVIFLEQWLTRRGRLSALIGVVVSVLCRLLFGAQWFIIPAMLLLVVTLTIARDPIEEEMERWK